MQRPSKESICDNSRLADLNIITDIEMLLSTDKVIKKKKTVRFHQREPKIDLDEAGEVFPAPPKGERREHELLAAELVTDVHL